MLLFLDIFQDHRDVLLAFLSVLLSSLYLSYFQRKRWKKQLQKIVERIVEDIEDHFKALRTIDIESISPMERNKSLRDEDTHMVPGWKLARETIEDQISFLGDGAFEKYRDSLKDLPKATYGSLCRYYELVVSLAIKLKRAKNRHDNDLISEFNKIRKNFYPFALEILCKLSKRIGDKGRDKFYLEIQEEYRLEREERGSMSSEPLKSYSREEIEEFYRRKDKQLPGAPSNIF